MENLHPITVHFTIALFISAIGFEVVGWVWKKSSLINAGWWNLLLATTAAIASVATGFSAASSAPHNDDIHQVIRIHQTIGLIVLGLIIVLFLWRLIGGGKWVSRGLPFYLGMGVITAGLIMIGGYYGGELVYTHGMGVKPMMEMMAGEEHDHLSHDEGTSAHRPMEADSTAQTKSSGENHPHSDADDHQH
jgi:uncharacterized membrane protein